MSYLLKHGTNRKGPKPPKTSQKEVKRHETSRNKLKRLRYNPKRSKITELGKIWNFLLVFLSQVFSPDHQISAFWVENHKFSSILTKFRLYLFQRCWEKRYELSNLNQILHVLYFVSASFKLPNLKFFCQNFEPKSPDLSNLGQKVLTF